MLHYFSQFSCWQGACLAQELLAAKKSGQRWNRTDIVLLPKPLMQLGIDLGKDESTILLARRYFKNRRERAAWAAPRRPKIDQDRHGAFCYQFGQRGRVYVNRAAEKQLLAFPATCGAGQSARCCAITLPAMRTPDFHDTSFSLQFTQARHMQRSQNFTPRSDEHTPLHFPLAPASA
ncbi:MAG: hypothetical protein Q7T06_10600 [Herminiimonas sp.]|nr:hypothetical protein [Herminiimonas sp.]MDO8306227.1 hypothetical protein [Herminiimonas sp.]